MAIVSKYLAINKVLWGNFNCWLRIKPKRIWIFVEETWKQTWKQTFCIIIVHEVFIVFPPMPSSKRKKCFWNSEIFCSQIQKAGEGLLLSNAKKTIASKLWRCMNVGRQCLAQFLHRLAFAYSTWQSCSRNKWWIVLAVQMKQHVRMVVDGLILVLLTIMAWMIMNSLLNIIYTHYNMLI